MLVLSRKQNQEILIGNQIKITVLKARGNTVRLGIEAPRDVKVVRGELACDSSAQSTADADNAEFTVVFGQPEASVDPKQSDDLETVQFEVDYSGSRSHKTPPSSENRLPAKTKKIDSASEHAETIRFQGQLPKVLQHNRLKNIVDRITTESKK